MMHPDRINQSNWPRGATFPHRLMWLSLSFLGDCNELYTNWALTPSFIIMSHNTKVCR